ncbi:PEP-CTERM sorting domain-containing protein [Uliginosibacterium sp. H3]|uniref:PEP-CTERM sorting domain-containing protein n=1 Tax=Uliginosibacterium silvisoli TaxID=3114758 RepID=A0ABU6K259_9RHOO|nr:PEP-CTERM sorting domain-containing protein [Uliginosibacterium sp. H3]
MQFKWKQFAAALAIGCASALAQSAVLVDTGTPPEPLGYSFSNTFYFAGEFSLAQSSVIDSIQGYFGTKEGSVAITVYGDGGDIPGSSIFSTSFATVAGDTNWNGVSGLGWALGAGTYWVSFAPNFVTAGDVADVSMPGGALVPLEHYAYYSGSGNNAWNPTGAAVGVRIESAAAVPEPSTILMYGVGIIGLGFMARRRSK